MNEIKPLDYFLNELEQLDQAIDMSIKIHQEEMKKLRYKRREVISMMRLYDLINTDKS